MSYRKETTDRDERILNQDWTAALLEDHVRADLERVFGETWAKWRERAPWTVQDIVDSSIVTLTRLVESAQAAARKAEGVETAKGTHDRLRKLRAGTRVWEHGESWTRWYVIPAPADWLNGLLADALYEYPEDIPEWGSWDRNRDERDAYVEEALADLVEQIYGERPGRIEIRCDYDCTGRTGATMHARQVGRRVLVTNAFYLDI